MKNNELNSLNLTQRMISDFSSRRGKYRQPNILKEYGWTAVPNVKEFSLKVNDWNPKWKSIGLNIRHSPTIKAKMITNKGFNKYMTYQIKRLEKFKYDDGSYNPNFGIDYFKLVLKLMRYSKAFRMSAWHKIAPLWYLNSSLKRMIYLNRKIDRIVEKLDGNLNHRRVYIPKGDSFRPLGVPTMEWRIALHMLNNFIFQFVKLELLNSQHGFIKGRGTMTAWREVMNKIIEKKFIYECDLKQFFPSISHAVLDYRLFMTGMPKNISNWIDRVNQSTPFLPKKRLLDESNTIRKSKEVREMKLWGDPEFSVGSSFGVAQGSPISPLISILGLDQFLTQIPSVSYADDPIFYFDHDFEIRDNKEQGIVIHKDKSFWVKRGGKWLKRLKYLGLVYDPINNTLSNNTRRKSMETPLTLTMEKVMEILTVFKIRPIEKDIKSIKNWATLLNSKIFGVIMAKLYNNSWDRPEESRNHTEVHPNTISVWMAV
jgi:hypothetical protein